MIHDKPLAGVTTDQRIHPAGREGSLLSLNEVAERAWKARMSPRLRAWVTQVLDKAGVSRGTRRQKAQAILDEYRKKVPYVADPIMGEFMATPLQTLCLDEGGLCIVGGDCDDAAIVLIACMLCLGIPAMVIGSSHKHPHEVPTHVFGAFQDEQEDWVRMDGTTSHPVGKVSPHQREWWVEPGAEAKDRGEGDFVGMAGGSEVGVSGPARTIVSKLDLLYPSIK
jgi:transglutaminase-like putative cysteine protease